MVASMGRNVIAVDAMADNLAYIRASLELGQNAEKFIVLSGITHTPCTILFNIFIISNNHVTLFPVPYDEESDLVENPGSLKLVDEEELQNSHLTV